MKKQITLSDMNNINSLLQEECLVYKYPYTPVTIPSELMNSEKRSHDTTISTNLFFSELFLLYSENQGIFLMAVFDYCHSSGIDLLSIFDGLFITNEAAQYENHPERLNVILMAYRFKFFEPCHDFTPYFISFKKPSRKVINLQFELIKCLEKDTGENSFDAHCNLFNDYLKVASGICEESRYLLYKHFEKFKGEDFYKRRQADCEKFYSSILPIDKFLASRVVFDMA